MANEQAGIYINSTKMQMESLSVGGSYVEMLGETTYRIAHYDQMPPFFMSLVSSGDHWLFIASISAILNSHTRTKNPDHYGTRYEEYRFRTDNPIIPNA